MSREFVEALLGIKREGYAWTIDSYPKDEDGWQAEPDGTITQGPRDAPQELLDQLAADPKVGKKFKMLDDDGNTYFVGRLLYTEADDDGDDPLFFPMYDLGEGYGCTEIQYKEKTKAGGMAWTAL